MGGQGLCSVTANKKSCSTIRYCAIQTTVNLQLFNVFSLMDE